MGTMSDSERQFTETPRLFDLKVNKDTGEIITFTVTPDTTPKHIVYGGYNVRQREKLEPKGVGKKVGVDY